jgi:epoxide hydrolase
MSSGGPRTWKSKPFSPTYSADQVHNVVRWSEFDQGGHFAALEAPDLLGADVRDFFRALD